MNEDMVTTIEFDGVAYSLNESEKLTCKELAESIKYSLKTLSEMKKAGCPFFGRFSSVSILRTWEYKNPDWRQNLKEKTSRNLSKPLETS